MTNASAVSEKKPPLLGVDLEWFQGLQDAVHTFKKRHQKYLTFACAWQTWNFVVTIRGKVTQESGISCKGIQQPNIVRMLKKFQGAAGFDSYRTCLVIFICWNFVAYFSNHYFRSIKITTFIVFCTPTCVYTWNQQKNFL